jgi:hypothetical protein
MRRRRKGGVVTCVIANMKNEALTAFVREGVLDKVSLLSTDQSLQARNSPMLICRSELSSNMSDGSVLQLVEETILHKSINRYLKGFKKELWFYGLI